MKKIRTVRPKIYSVLVCNGLVDLVDLLTYFYMCRLVDLDNLI